MAITRSQQAKQLLANGGRIGLKGGADAATESFAKSYDRAVGNAPGTTKGRKGSVNISPSGNVTFDPGGKDSPPQEFIGGKSYDVTPKTVEKRNFARSLENDRKRRERRKRALEKQKLFKTISLRNKLMLDPTIRTLDDNLVDVGAIDDQGLTIGGIKVPSFITGATSAFTVDPSTKYFDEDSIREIGSVLSKSKTGITKSQADTLADIREDITMRDRILDPNDTVTQSEFDEYINRNKIEVPDRDGPSDPCLGPNPPAYCFIGDKADDTQEAVVTRNLSGLTPRIGGSIFDFTGMADGGIASMDREAFLLGGLAKGLKKAVRGVKKLAKSPIGKAALLGAVGFGLGGKGAIGSFFGKGSFNPFLRKVAGDTAFSGLGSILSKAGLVNKAGSLTALGMIGVPTVASLFMTPKEDENDELAKYLASQKLEPSQSIRGMGSEFDFYGGERMRVADGGDVEPVAKKTMPLLDMDGKEKDYRETGGFVDMGRMERADDVPARLSKNEFVFTADAVRNAGEGDIDKGAEVMYNMMKNLEAGGEVSEESQGLDGARNMFQTAK